MTKYKRPKKVDQIGSGISQSGKHRIIFEHASNPRDFISVTSTASTKSFKPYCWVIILGSLCLLLLYDFDDNSHDNNKNANTDIVSIRRLGSSGRYHFWEENSPVKVMHEGGKEFSMTQFG